MSQHSSKRRSVRTDRSTQLSDLLIEKRAEAESARVGLHFSKRESELRRTQFEMDERLKLLELEKQLAIAETEVKVIQEVEGNSTGPPPLLLPEDPPHDRVQEYIDSLNQNTQEIDTIPQQQPQPTDTVHVTPRQSTTATDNISASVKKELLFSRLTKFDDTPETYMIWKETFTSVMDEFQLSVHDHLDLLFKYLGPESKRQTLSLRTANLHDPAHALRLIWQRLNQRYGAPEMLESSLRSRLDKLPKLTNRDGKRLYELSDLLMEINSLKANDKYRSLLSYFDTSSGVNPIVQKLPYGLQEKWSNVAFGYKQRYNVPYPPFTVFVDFIYDICLQKNDPSFQYDTPSNVDHSKFKSTTTTQIRARRTDVNDQDTHRCPIHNSRHSLNDCKAFLDKSYQDKVNFLKTKHICFKCCISTDHVARECTEKLKCIKCGSTRHVTAMHDDNFKPAQPTPSHGREVRRFQTDDSANSNVSPEPISSKCTQICGNSSDVFQGKSCAKNVLVTVYPKGKREQATRMYATIDDQSNASLCRSSFFTKFSMQGDSIPYTLSSCAGQIETTGRRASDFVISSLDGKVTFQLPPLVECNNIPDIKEEIPTPDIAMHHPHLKRIAKYIPELEDSSQIELLLGRDLLEAHHILEQITGPRGSPYAQKLPLGWVIVGEACLGKTHSSQHVNVNKLYTLDNGRPSILQPCPNNMFIKEDCESGLIEEDSDIFHTTAQDERSGTSVQDRQFLDIMNRDMYRNDKGSWVAPLPFMTPRKTLPNNKPQAVQRSNMLDRNLKRHPEKREHFQEFMQKVFDNNHAELAPPLQENEECWYLPIFGVYHPKKPSQIRAVFDSSAQYRGISLNSVLLPGPDLTNDLLGILLRFRREPIAILADIQQMFHCFEVDESHRNYLRFLWYKDNRFENEIVDFRMRVHVFGNRPSPAVATYGLRRVAEMGEKRFGTDTKEFVQNNFYVDDAVTSLPTPEQATDLLKRTQKSLQINGNLRLHKIISNSTEVMKSFPPEDLAKDLKMLDLQLDTFPLQRSLGILWDVQKDVFTFRLPAEDKSCTKRGILSTVNSIFDPMGLVAPVIVQGKLILRDVVAAGLEWDDIVPDEHLERWKIWRTSLKALEQLQIPRTFLPFSFQETDQKEIHVYCDASESVIAASAYVKAVNPEGGVSYGYLLGKAKVSPKHGHTIPRLELCAAVLATDISLLVTDYLNVPSESVTYHTDSKIVLGYVNNQTKRFSVYVTNRVERIRRCSSPQQWQYVSTRHNPADQATRPVAAENMEGNSWLQGPTDVQEPEDNHADSLQETETEQETLPLPQNKQSTRLDTKRFQRFSRWDSLVRAVSQLKTFIRKRHRSTAIDCSTDDTKHIHQTTETFIIKQVQQEVYAKEITHIKMRSTLPKDSPIAALNPFLDSDGILRVGGRLGKSDLERNLKHPVIVPGKHHVAVLLVRHHHNVIQHQGRHFTEGAVRSAGWWITGVKRLVSSVIHKCVTCKKLRGKQESQIMADLPTDRFTRSPPFSYVGVDTFGPWEVISRKTRGGVAHSKRWAILFNCLVTRAIHVEVVEEMSTSSFINALRRFVALRGKVQMFRSDRGTNFLGATDLIRVDAVNVEDKPVQDFLSKEQAKWVFNPPHSSHMSGSWERMIGTVRRILDKMMRDVSPKKFTHEVLTTFMAEVCAIVNARPIVAVSSDPEQPHLLTPATLLTQKTDHVVTPLKDCTGSIKELYLKEWRQVQALADMFWNRFQSEYLQTLQQRQKWQHAKENIKDGDIVLLKEKNLHRNDWPMGRVINAIPSSDRRVRKAEVKIVRDGKTVTFTRPITEIILLLSP